MTVTVKADKRGPGRRSISVMLGHACETLAVMYLQEGPRLRKIDPPRIERIERIESASTERTE